MAGHLVKIQIHGERIAVDHEPGPIWSMATTQPGSSLQTGLRKG